MSQRLAAFPYRGGKFHLAPRLVKLFPPYKIYVEVFGGAANLLLAKPPSQIEVYNDNNGLLVNLFEIVRNRPKDFLKRCRNIPYSRELYQAWKRDLTRIPKELVIHADRVDYAVKTFYIIVSSFTGDPTKGWAFQRSGRDGGPSRWLNVRQRVQALTERFRHVAIDHLDFRDCIKNWDSDETFFFLDPPYLTSKAHGWYGNDFTLKDHKDLADILFRVKAKWLMTLDDSPRVRDLYMGFVRHKISTKLSAQKVAKGTRRVNLNQILVSNYQYDPEPLQ